MKMYKTVALTFLGIALSFSVFSQATWKADANHSKLAFTTTHLGISDVSGLFNTFEATIVSGKSDFSDAQFNLSVQVGSVDTEVAMRDNHLRSADFFSVEQFPTMDYKSTSVMKVGTDRYKLTGELTLHGVTQEVVMDLWYRGTIENPQSKAVTSGFQLTGTLKRSDFNIGSKFPDGMISDEVRIKADGEFVKQEG